MRMSLKAKQLTVNRIFPSIFQNEMSLTARFIGQPANGYDGFQTFRFIDRQMRNSAVEDANSSIFYSTALQCEQNGQTVQETCSSELIQF